MRYVIVPAGTHVRLGSHLRPIYHGARARVYENTLAYPRAYFADRVRAVTNPRRILRHVTSPGFDGRRLALVESAVAPTGSAPTSPATADVRRDGPDELTVSTTAPEPRFLVVSEMYFPGWRAYVDGVETTIYRTNYLFRGVAVPAGRHTVTFVYRPTSVAIGAGISALAMLVLAGLLLLRGTRAV